MSTTSGRRGTPTTAYDSNGDVVKTFTRQYQAVDWIISKNPSLNRKSVATYLSRVAKNHQEAYGYKWKSEYRQINKAKIASFADANRNLMSASELGQTFKVGMRTIKSYIEDQLLPRPAHIVEEEAFFSRQEIYDMLGLQQPPNEPFLTPREMCKILGMQNLKELVAFVRYYKLPYYYLKKSKGSPHYFLLSEVKAAMEWRRIHWNQDFANNMVRVQSLEKIYKTIVSNAVTSDLSEKELKVFNGYILNGESSFEIAQEVKTSVEYTRIIFKNTYPKIMDGISKLHEGYKNSDSLLSSNKHLEQENLKLKEENQFLRDQLSVLKMPPESIVPINSDEKTPVRVKSLLKAMEVNSLLELSKKYRRHEAFKFQNAGKKTIEMVDEMLKENNLTWRI